MLDLSTENPWWNEGGLWQDPDLVRVKKSRLLYRPQLIDPALCKSKAVLTLRGPRRVGKTVSLKLLIAELIEAHGWPPRSITWLNFDTVRTLRRAEEILTEACTTFRPALLCIDEVTAVTGWQRVVKKLRDMGPLAESTVILTGSSSYDLKSGAERMAGRRGSVDDPDRVLLPMNFPDFLAQLQHNKLELPKKDAADIYLELGGFPFRVEEYLNNAIAGKPMDPAAGMSVFDDVVFYEVSRRRLDRSIALEILARLNAVQPGCVSYQGFAKALTVAKDTARKYLDMLGDAYLLATISSWDSGRGRVAPKKDRKFIWIDPAFGYLAQHLGQGAAAPPAARAEWLAGAQLLRLYERRLFEGLSAPRNVFTWKSSGGNEIDYLVIDKAQDIFFPVEVKYQNSISDWDFQVMERAFGKGWLVSIKDSRLRAKSEGLTLAEYLLRTQLPV